MIFRETPAETDPRYFRTWQRVSLELQRRLRTVVPAAVYRDASLYEDRDAAHQWIVYEACRLFYGRPRTDFAYDVADPEALPAALRAIGKAIQTVLERIERQLHEAGRPELARRYGPVWHEDVWRAVRRKPKRLVALLACESRVINALIDWGTMRTESAEKRLNRAVAAAARVYGVDARVVSETLDGLDHVLDSGVPENADAIAAGCPDRRVA